MLYSLSGFMLEGFALGLIRNGAVVFYLFFIIFIIGFIAFVYNINNKTKGVWLSYIVFLLTNLTMIVWTVLLDLVRVLRQPVKLVSIIDSVNLHLNVIIIYSIILLPVLYIAFNYLNRLWRVFVLLKTALFFIIYYSTIEHSTLCFIKSCPDLTIAQRLFAGVGAYMSTMYGIVSLVFFTLLFIRYIELYKQKKRYMILWFTGIICISMALPFFVLSEAGLYVFLGLVTCFVLMQVVLPLALIFKYFVYWREDYKPWLQQK